MAIKELLQLTIDRNASDLHIVAGIPPTLRIDGQLTPVPNEAVLTPEVIASYLKEILSSEQLERLKVNKELDFSLSFSDKARFRVNAYTQKRLLCFGFQKDTSGDSSN